MYDIYTIQEEDTLDSIAEKFGTTKEKLYELNLNFDPIEYFVPGNKIIVPVSKPSAFEYYTVKKGDTLYNIARQFNIDPTKLAEINGLDNSDYIYDNQVLLVPKDGVEIIITKQGDTFEKITKNLDATALDLLFQNQNIYLLPDQLITYKKTSKNN